VRIGVLLVAFGMGLVVAGLVGVAAPAPAGAPALRLCAGAGRPEVGATLVLTRRGCLALGRRRPPR
jgi:hypothetical protein